MKTLIILISLVLNVGLLYSQGTIKLEYDSIVIKQSYRDTNFHMYYVQRITRVKNGYALLLCREIDGKKRCFNVLTTKYGKHKQGVKIKCKKYYYLKIYAYYEYDRLLNNGMLFDAIVHGKQVASPPNKWRSNVYTSPNVNGLFYTLQPTNE
ncbi:MAG: hypothetical protein KAG64_07570 [Bacteroidales bacterium]|nr:hypothetical protein [Bacteroidales bacterium]